MCVQLYVPTYVHTAVYGKNATVKIENGRMNSYLKKNQNQPSASGIDSNKVLVSVVYLFRIPVQFFFFFFFNMDNVNFEIS